MASFKSKSGGKKKVDHNSDAEDQQDIGDGNSMCYSCDDTSDGKKSSMSNGTSERSSEELHWFDVMRTFLAYGDMLESDLARRQVHLNRLNTYQASKLPNLTFDRQSDANEALLTNMGFFRKMVAFYQDSTQDWGNRRGQMPPGNKRYLPDPYDGPKISLVQQHRNEAVLHSLSREWSDNGTAERAMTFDAIVQELKYRLPVKADGSNAYMQRVLVPGCGLARLPVDICKEGYSVEGNEFSAYMLMASNYILNGVYLARSIPICPFVDKVCNIIHVKDVVEPLLIPDIPASSILETAYKRWDSGDSAIEEARNNAVSYARFSMAAGDFNELYGPSREREQDDAEKKKLQERDINDTEDVEGIEEGEGDRMTQISKAGTYDAVVTCFFIDTAPIVIDYLDTIHYCLRPGGMWINFGPLLFHWQADSEGNGDSRYDSSIELSWEELREVINAMGFRLLTHRGYKSKAEIKAAATASSPVAGTGTGTETEEEKAVYLDDGTVKVVQVAYTKPKNSLMWTQYAALFFTAERI